MLWFGFDSFSKTAKAGILNHIVEGKRNGTKIVFFNRSRLRWLTGWRTNITPSNTDRPGCSHGHDKVIIDQKLYQGDFLKNYTDAGALIDTETKMHVADDKGTWLAWDAAAKQAAPINKCPGMALDGGPYTLELNGKKITAKPVLQLLQESIAKCTPDWAQQISEVPGEDITRIAQEFAKAAPTVCIPNLKRDAAGPNYANSWRLMQSINILHALTGSFDHDGGVLFLHGVKIPWLEEVDPLAKPYPEQPKEPIDYRNQFPVTHIFT
jgi:anaerobic selenocysteine-containing dehydrogenase